MVDLTRYERNPNFIFRNIVGEMILVPIQNDVADMDCIYSLNEVGAFVWQQIDSPATKAELENILLHDYDADSEKLKADLKIFLDEMVTIGALRKV